MKQKKVFLSYSWKDFELADKIDSDFSKVGVRLIRDIRDLEYQGSIPDFVPTKLKSDYSICIISDTFIKSENCMWEIIDLWKKDLLQQQICSVIVDSLQLDQNTILEYSNYWESKYNELDANINQIDDNVKKKPFIILLERYKWINTYVSDFLFYICKSNYLKFSDIIQNGLRAYSNTIYKRIGIKPSDNIEKLYQISQAPNIELFETGAEKYLVESTVEPTDLFYFTRGSAYDRFGYYSLAVYNYNRALQYNKKYVPAIEALVKMYFSGHDKDRIDVDCLITLLDQIEGEKAFVEKSRGMKLFATQPKEALSHFSESKKLNPTDEYIYNNLGCTYESMNNLELAISHYKEAVKINPNYYQAYNNLAIAYIKCRDLSNAKDALDKCLKVNPDYHYGLNTQGLLFEEYGYFDKAINSYLNAIKLKIWSAPFTNIGRIYEYEYNLPIICRNYYECAASLSPNIPVTQFNLGNYYRKYTNDCTQSNKFLRRTLELAPDNALCNLSFGLLLWKEKNYADASNYFAFSYICEKELGVSCYWLGRVLIHNDEVDSAKELLQKYRKQNNNILVDFLLYTLYCQTVDASQELLQEITLVWEQDCMFGHILTGIKNDNLYNVLDHISEKQISFSKGLIYKDSKLVPLINFEEAYEYIKENFFKL